MGTLIPTNPEIFVKKSLPVFEKNIFQKFVENLHFWKLGGK